MNKISDCKFPYFYHSICIVFRQKRKPKVYKRRMSPNVLHCPLGGLPFHCGGDTSKQKSLLKLINTATSKRSNREKDSTTSGYEEATKRFGNQVRVELTLFGQHASPACS
jgi:hypothetical protein